MAQPYFVKSLEEDFATKTLCGKKKETCQAIGEIIKTRKLKPNTKSFGRKMRLSSTILHRNYLKTYRPQGIIFQTEARPDYVIPFDLVLLSATDKIVVQYYRIKDNLDLYYNHALISGFEKFIFKDFDKMMKSFPATQSAWIAVNKFRKENGFSALKIQKRRLVLYNEAVFHKTISIKPVAVFGYRKEARIIAKKCGLSCFSSARKFYENALAKN